MKIDRRKNYYLVVDVETACGMENPIAYDIGFAVCDKKGNVYEQKSYLIQEIFFDEKRIYGNAEMMKNAYYSEKLPQYYKGLFEEKKHECKSIYYIKKVVENVCAKYGIKAICAYNAWFDDRALRYTIRYITKSKVQEFFPTNIEIFDIWNMACQTIGQKVDYHRFCYENNLLTPADNCKTSAETMYAYLTKCADFEEEHTGLADVLIECSIMANTFKFHKSIVKTIEPMPWKKVQPKFHEVVARYYGI